MQAVVERVINLLIFLLESPHPVTADEVRQTVQGYDQGTDDAFHRMFERDKDVLRKLGVPLERKALDVWEVDYGYTVDPDQYALADPGLDEKERVALSVAARMVRLGEGNAGLEALLKLGGAERGMGLEPLGADLGAQSEVLGDLFTAVSERRRIEFDYRERRRSLEPYGLAHRRGHWYLAGNTSDGVRMYRVDRLSRLEVGEQPGSFKRPRGFKIRDVMDAQPWETGSDAVVTARVRFDPDVAWWAARTLGARAEQGASLEIDVPVSNRDAFIGWILSFGDSAEILGPDDLRSDLASRVEAALEHL